MDPGNSGHFFNDPAESRSNSILYIYSIYLYILKLYNSKSLYIADTFFKHRANILDNVYLLIADTLMIVWEKRENASMFLFDAFFNLTRNSLSNFSELFFTRAINPASP